MTLANVSLGILVFSQHIETAWSSRLLADGAAGIGHPLT